jgi:hypothetical protein
MCTETNFCSCTIHISSTLLLGRILHIAHSGGAIITYLAAKYHLSSEERSKIDVVTLGAGRSLTRKYFSGKVINYYTRNDPCLLIDQRGNLF